MALTKIRGNTQILEGSVTNAQIALPTGVDGDVGILLTKIEDGNLLVKSDGSVGFSAPISGVTPTAGNHLVTKSYVDAAAQGLDVKASVRAVATTNVALSGLQEVDGVGLVAGDRVLLTGQDAVVANGIYVVAEGGWTRALDATTNADVTPGLFTFVEEGSVNAGTGWVLTSTGPTTLGTTPLPFTQFSTAGIIDAGAGLAKDGNTLSVVSDNGGIVVTGDAIALTVDGPTLTVGPDGIRLADLAEGQFLIGSDADVATPRTISGDITIDAAGVARIAPGAVGAATIVDGSLALDKLVGGTAGSMILVGADGRPTYTAVSGDVAMTPAGAITLNAGVVDTAELADEAVTLDKMEALPVGNIIMGTADGNVAVALSGDVTVDAAGVVSINPATVVRVQDMINREIPVGALNGVNDTFTLANVPRAGTECVYVNGMLQDSGAGNDYTIAGDTITWLGEPLEAVDKIRVSYFK